MNVALARTLVGTPLRRLEDERLLRGLGRYLDDVELPRLAHAAFVRSPHAHARIRGVRKPADGALVVLTADDVAGDVRELPVNRVEGVELMDGAHPVLARDEVQYVGQPVAIVVAESRALAEDHAELVEVDYEPLEPVLEARTSPETLMRFARSAGDVDGAFAAADHVVRTTIAIPRVVATPIEARGAIADYDPGTDLLTMYLSAQDPHRPRAGLAHTLKRPDDRLRIIVPDVGGAFGSKGVVAPEWVATALAAKRLGRPVKWAEDRLENFLAAYQGRGVEADVELAVAADGRFLAVRATIFADLGGYLLPTTPVAAHTTALLLCGCYRIPAAAVEVVGARTNKVPTGPYRGAGRPEAALLLEATVDAAARELGLDRVELRRRNLVPADAFPYETPLGWTYDSGDYERCLDRALELVPPERADGTGYGVALYVERAGGMWESAEVTVEPSGRVVAASGTSPHGQGHATTFTQIVCDELGVDPDDVTVRFGDTASTPRGVGTFASRSVAMGGSALLLACRDLRAKIDRLGEALETAELRQIAAAAYDPGRLPPGEELGLNGSARFTSPLVFSSGCYAAVAAVDRATGKVIVRRIAAIDDAGTIVNPLLAEGQVVGGIAQALGECLTEEAVYDEVGQLRSASLLDYSLPTAAEVPEIRTAFVETPSPFNPLGAKGIGEGGTIGALAAVANAVADAVGEWVDPPFTEEKIWHVLHRKGEA
ncbi:MAG: xanthine dehydrogenase family protein molybdopterin-binding subunit [Thermoleophilia bacterium]|nr:xanthine dehydrogenase family protein molybdopterin-binding subunit [Thermoleophilia bacterium]